MSLMVCEHANEVPHHCPCNDDCYCKKNTCLPHEKDGHRVSQRIDKLKKALQPLAKIAAQYLEDGLDEARPYWVKRGISRFDSSVELYCGRGGGRLLTLLDCINAWELLYGRTFPIPEADQKVIRAKEVYDSLYVGGQGWSDLSEERQNEYAEKVAEMDKKNAHRT